MTSKNSTASAHKEALSKIPWKGKWVYCYLPRVDCAVKILDQGSNYWVVDHPHERVVKCACSSTPSTKLKAVRNPRG